MASLEIVALDTVTPQLRAPGVGDTYAVPRSMIMANTLSYNFNDANTGISFASGSLVMAFTAGNRGALQVFGGGPYGINVEHRIGLSPSGPSTADVGIERVAAKVMKISDGGVALAPSGAGVLQLPTFTVATLPTAATAGAGARSTVSDGSVVAAGNFGTIVAGAGANIVPVYSDATNWRIG